MRVARLERRQRRLGLGDHRAIARRRHLDPAKTLGKGHDAKGQRHRAENFHPRLPAARPFLPHPDDLGRPAADVEHDRIGNARVQQRRAAGDDKPRLLGGGDDLEFDADRLAYLGEEIGAIRGTPARLGGDIAAPCDLALVDLAGADPQRLYRARHRRCGEGAGRGQALAKPHDPRKRVDDAKSAAGAARDQEAAVVGSEVERGIARRHLPRRRREPVALGQIERRRRFGPQHRGVRRRQTRTGRSGDMMQTARHKVIVTQQRGAGKRSACQPRFRLRRPLPLIPPCRQPQAQRLEADKALGVLLVVDLVFLEGDVRLAVEAVWRLPSNHPRRPLVKLQPAPGPRPYPGSCRSGPAASRAPARTRSRYRSARHSAASTRP